MRRGDTATTGDIFDGGIGPKAAAHVLLQDTIYQPYVRNVYTLCQGGTGRGGYGCINMEWQVCLSGPELLRMDADGVSTGRVMEEYDANTATTTDFEDLCQYNC